MDRTVPENEFAEVFEDDIDQDEEQEGAYFYVDENGVAHKVDPEAVAGKKGKKAKKPKMSAEDYEAKRQSWDKKLCKSSGCRRDAMVGKIWCEYHQKAKDTEAKRKQNVENGRVIRDWEKREREDMKAKRQFDRATEEINVRKKKNDITRSEMEDSWAKSEEAPKPPPPSTKGQKKQQQQEQAGVPENAAAPNQEQTGSTTDSINRKDEQANQDDKNLRAQSEEFEQLRKEIRQSEKRMRKVTQTVADTASKGRTVNVEQVAQKQLKRAVKPKGISDKTAKAVRLISEEGPSTEQEPDEESEDEADKLLREFRDETDVANMDIA